jgi:NIPSNAP
MKRRAFLGLIGAAYAAGNAGKTRYYAVGNYFLKNATEKARLKDYFSRNRLPGMLVLEALVAPHMPQVMCISSYSLLEPPFEPQSVRLIEAVVQPAAERRTTPRVFEWRSYHSLAFSRLKALQCKIFPRVGIHPVLYANGPDVPNFAYLIPFDNLAAREKAWAAFGADPEWITAQKESSAMQISLWKVMRLPEHHDF